MSISINEKFINILDTELCYLEKYLPNKPTILLLHGWLNCSTIYKNLMNNLNDFRLIALDLPGFGKSKEIQNNSISSTSNYILSFLHKLNVQKPIIFGVSYSSLITLNLITQFPKLFSAAIFQTLPYKLYDHLSDQQKLLLKTNANEDIRKIANNFIKSPLFLHLITRVIKSDHQISENTIKDIFDHAKNLSPKTAYETIKMVCENDDITFDQINILNSQNLKYLLLIGTKDNTFAIPEEIKPENIKYILNGDHKLIVEKAQEVANIIQNFCK